MLWLVQRVFFGPLNNEKNKKLKDLSLREGVVLLPLIVVVFVIGLFPNLFLAKVEPSINHFVEDVRSRSNVEFTMADDVTSNDEKPAADAAETNEKEVPHAVAH